MGRKECVEFGFFKSEVFEGKFGDFGSILFERIDLGQKMTIAPVSFDEVQDSCVAAPLPSSLIEEGGKVDPLKKGAPRRVDLGWIDRVLRVELFNQLDVCQLCVIWEIGHLTPPFLFQYH